MSKNKQNHPYFIEPVGKRGTSKGKYSHRGFGKHIKEEALSRTSRKVKGKDGKLIYLGPWNIERLPAKTIVEEKEVPRKPSEIGYMTGLTKKIKVKKTIHPEPIYHARVSPNAPYKPFQPTVKNATHIGGLNRVNFHPVHEAIRPVRYALIHMPTGEYTLHATQSFVDSIDMGTKGQLTIGFQGKDGIKKYTYKGATGTFAKRFQEGMYTEMHNGENFSIGKWVQANVGGDYDAPKVKVGKKEYMQPLNKNLRITKVRG